MFVPLVNRLVALVLAIDLAKAYGKGTGFVLGFGSAEYVGAPGGR